MPPSKFRAWRLERIERDIDRFDAALYYRESQRLGGPLLRPAR